MRLTAVLLGVFFTLAAAIMAGEMIKSSEPFEPLVPCTLAVLGFGLFGFGLLFPFSPLQPDQCSIGGREESSETPEIDDE